MTRRLRLEKHLLAIAVKALNDVYIEGGETESASSRAAANRFDAVTANDQPTAPGMTESIDQSLLELLVCPRDRSRLAVAGHTLKCEHGHTYAVVRGVPVMLVYDAPQTQHVIGRSLREAFFPKPGELQPAHTDAAVDPFVQSMVAMTSGQLYAPIVGKLTRHPIPSLRLPESNGDLLLDVGCNWGRWTIAASRLGYEAVGIDPSLQAILAARRVAKKEGSAARFVVGDARFLPFAESSTDLVFSYSVLQHFSDADVMMALREFARVLRPGGRSLVQMANSAGVRSFYHQAARRMREAKNFEVRYRSTTKLREMFRLIIGESVISVDGYFGLGVQPNDIDLLPRRYRAVVVASEWIRRLSLSVPGLTTFADSVYVDSIKSRRVTSNV